jgi:hypothetical protein
MQRFISLSNFNTQTTTKHTSFFLGEFAREER